MSFSLLIKKNKVLFSCALFFLSFSFSSASNLTISPDTLFVEKGKSFVVSFYVNDNDRAINAVSAQISYPKDLLSLQSFSKDGSILQMWSEEPSFSNTAGTAHFEGVILNPGFGAKKGLLVTARFLPLQTGVATLRFTSGNIYANDGKATDLLSLLGTATYTISDRKNLDSLAPSKDIKQSQIKQKDDGAPLLSSPSHPDSDTWYSDKNIIISALFDKDATETKYHFSLVGQTGDEVTSEIKDKITLNAKEDGDYLVDVKQKVKGVWGMSSVYEAHIDTTPPYDVVANLSSSTTTSKLRQKVSLSAKDTLSGVARFEVSLNNGTPLVVTANELGEAQLDLPKADLKDNVLDIVAFDFANNSAKISLPFFIKPLDVPKVTSYTKDIRSEQFFKLDAKTYPGAKLSLRLQGEADSIEKTFSADENGDASLQTIVSDPGEYSLLIKVLQYDGGESVTTSIGSLRVHYSFAWLFSFVNVQGVVALLFAIILVILTASLTFFTTRKKLVTTITKEEVLPLIKEIEEAEKQKENENYKGEETSF